MITIEFKDFEEMKGFARELLKGEMAAAPVQTMQPVSMPRPEPVKTVPAVPSAAAPASAPQPVPAPAPTAAPVSITPSVPTVPVSRPAPEAPAVSPVPVSQTSYTQDDLARAAIVLMDTGRQAELMELLSRFGVVSLPDLPKDQYGAFATALRGMGAQI